MLELKNISKRFGEKQIISDLNLKVPEKQILAIVGPSGGGKTTLLRMLAGLETIDSGDIIYNGEELPLDELEKRNLLGFVFQDFQLFPHLTVLENLTLSPIKTKNVAKEDAEKKAINLLTRLGLAEHVNAYPYSLSGGQKQRISIARAIARNPEIYIFDDSFSALDYKTDSILRKELKKYTKDATTLIVAQRIGTIMNADKILVLDDGNLVGMGTHKELLESCEVYKQIALSQLSKEELDNA